MEGFELNVDWAKLVMVGVGLDGDEPGEELEADVEDEVEMEMMTDEEAEAAPLGA